VAPDIADATTTPRDNNQEHVCCSFASYVSIKDMGERLPHIISQMAMYRPRDINDYNDSTTYTGAHHREGRRQLRPFLYKGVDYFSNFYFPGYQPLAGCRLAFGARTGGATAITSLMTQH